MHSLALVVLVDVAVLAADAEVVVATLDVLTVEAPPEATAVEVAAAVVSAMEVAVFEMEETTAVDDALVADTTALLTAVAADVDAATSEVAELLTGTAMTEVALVIASADVAVVLSDADTAEVEPDESPDSPTVKSTQSS